MSAAQIAGDLADRIKRGEYPPASRLPTYRELANIYSVGETTITTVVLILKQSGIVVGMQGRGVFVAEKGSWPRQG